MWSPWSQARDLTAYPPNPTNHILPAPLQQGRSALRGSEPQSLDRLTAINPARTIESRPWLAYQAGSSHTPLKEDNVQEQTYQA
jgi:hypothetical protein